MSEAKKLVLHVGLPKTGASAFQIWCHRNREALRRRGVDFPETNGGPPKHQFLIRALGFNRMDWLQRILASDANTILISTEAITMRLYDFDPAALENFRRVTYNHDVTVCMVTREINAWRRSYYKQMVITTPPTPELCWGTALEYDAFCLLDRVTRLCDVSALEKDLRAAFDATVVVACYESTWMDELLGLLGISDVTGLRPMTREHVSVSDDVAEIIRQVNGMGLSVDDRVNFIRALRGPAQEAGDSLKFHYPGDASVHGPIDHVLSRLLPRTAVQAEWIEQLRQG